MLPHHSSHLIQPLDKIIFHDIKKNFNQSSRIKALSIISSPIERMLSSYQASSVIWKIWGSWKLTGIIPIIKNDECIHVQIDGNIILNNSLMQHNNKTNQAKTSMLINRSEYG